MNKQVTEYAEIDLIGLPRNNTRTLRNPKFYSLGLDERPIAGVAGTVFYCQSMPDLQVSYLINIVNSIDFSNCSRGYWA